MVRRGLIIGSSLALLVGCAGAPRQRQVARTDDIESGADAVAAALVFTPPVAADAPPIELARAEREPAAFVAFDQVFTTFIYRRLDDRQLISNDGRSSRRVISETFGISHR